MLSPGSPPASDTSQAVLNSMSAPQPVSTGYVCSSDVAMGSAVAPGRLEPSAKQQLGPTESLPLEVLLKVFRLVEPKQVHTAAQVCRSWRSAAVAAATSISVRFSNPESYLSAYSLTKKAVSLQQWIYRNGAGVQKMRLGVVAYTAGKLALPLAKLQQLQALSVSRLQLAQWDEPASSTAESRDAAAYVYPDVMRGVSAINQTSEALDGLSLLTSLTKLRLNHYPSESFSMLSALTGLQELYLTPENALSAPHNVGRISTAALQQLTRLTSLSISPTAIEHSATGYFSKLTSLQSLEYISVYPQYTTELKGLPDSLTQLKAVWGGGDLLTRQLALANLTSLQHLELSAVRSCDRRWISPCDIQDMSQLTYVALVGLCKDALESLLSAVGTLLQLRHLKLSITSVGGATRAVQQDLNQYSALTASSHLTYLGLLTARPMFTDGVGDYMFPPGRQLPDLKILRLGGDLHSPTTVIIGYYAYPILNQQALDRIVVNCPAIEELSLIDAVAENVHELVTAQLSGLTKLAINGSGVHNSMVKVMSARLSQLKDLTLKYAEVTDLGVWEMTRFTRLTRLRMRGSDRSAGLMVEGVYLECNKRKPTPVWQQLQATVRRSAKCAGVMLDRAERALQESRNRLAATHQQLSAVQQQLQQAMQASPGAGQQLQLEQVQQQLMAAVELAAGVDRQALEAEGVGQSELDAQMQGSDSDADDLSSDYCSDDATSDESDE